MDIKAIIAKALKGETLTTEEKSYAEAFDLQQEVNRAASGARKTAEQKLREKEEAIRAMQQEMEALRAEVDEKANAGKPEVEKLSRELEKLKKTVAERESALAKLETEKRGMVRGGKIGRLMSSLKFVEGIDPDLPRMALETALKEIGDDELDDEGTVKPILEQFRSRNKAMLLDPSKGGAGTGAKDGAGGSGGKSVWTRERIKALTPEEYEKNRDEIAAANAKGEIK